MSTGTPQTGAADPKLNNDPTPKNVADGNAPVAAAGARPVGEKQDIKEVDEGVHAKKAPAAGADGQHTGEQTSNGLPGKDGEGYPEQTHAGKVGYGPNAPRSGLGDMITGTIESIEGKLKHDPKLAQHGADVKSGVAEQRAHEAAEKETASDNPFANPDDKKGKKQAVNEKEADKADTKEGEAKAKEDKVLTN